jgi:hypothetical protein
MDREYGSDPGDGLHRVMKLALDTGEVGSLADAERLFAGYRLTIAIGPDVAASATLQAALLTAVNAGRRCFLGGVAVVGDLAVPLRVPWWRCATLAEAVADLGGLTATNAIAGIPRIVIGDVPVGDMGVAAATDFAVRATFDGWAGGAVPLDDGRRLAERQEFTPSGVLAGALAVSEAFQFVRGDVRAGRRAVGLSLWHPEPGAEWLAGAEPGPAPGRLPARLWLIGLGHLGQAFLWTLGFLPYARPGDVHLVLHDFDTLTAANDSTSLLTTSSLAGERKTRAMARWCDERGFRTTIVERRFAPDFTVAPDEPPVALCGVDNALARAALEEVGFARVIEAGLGGGTTEYLAFQLHTFPARRTARERWGSGGGGSTAPELLDQPAYRALAAEGFDACGLTQLAGRTVGAPFVGAVVAALTIAEVLRMVVGGPRYAVIDGTLRNVTQRQAIVGDEDAPFNPGSTEATSDEGVRT